MNIDAAKIAELRKLDATGMPGREFDAVVRKNFRPLLDEIERLQAELQLVSETKLYSRRKLEADNERLRRVVADWQQSYELASVEKYDELCWQALKPPAEAKAD